MGHTVEKAMKLSVNILVIFLNDYTYESVFSHYQPNVTPKSHKKKKTWQISKRCLPAKIVDSTGVS